MDNVPASTGWAWVKQGIALFRRQPAELSTLFISYMFLMLALNLIPLIGAMLPLLLVPVFAMSFMQACVQVEQGQRVYPSLLLTGFRSPAFRALLLLGTLYLLAAVLAVAASQLVDGGVFWNVMNGKMKLDAPEVRESAMPLGMLFSAAVYTPAAMAFWFAAPLIAWKDMSLAKAVFYSFFTVKKAGKAFLVYALAWFFLGIILPTIASAILALIGSQMLGLFVLMPLSIVLTVVMYCSFYATYTEFFGRPYAPPEAPPA
ncbi:BPSS1780 family membrane protein [Janthinobacterium sp. 17J80-10]|uniref:BPSS1780 family membrane protein n=1 Tax=Janthinobacterium sp. 17J80-10 TaxID=2497863 RepID=UPI001005A336|nr:BPSS1780 family membrane protein [Janthinobacterium sp. 17J80-10]QAU35738.1 hypothetical protein EKL02_17075 [Janthinobacterium sp. 17J80-10]